MSKTLERQCYVAFYRVSLNFLALQPGVWCSLQVSTESRYSRTDRKPPSPKRRSKQAGANYEPCSQITARCRPRSDGAAVCGSHFAESDEGSVCNLKAKLKQMLENESSAGLLWTAIKKKKKSHEQAGVFVLRATQPFVWRPVVSKASGKWDAILWENGAILVRPCRLECGAECYTAD